MISGAANSVRAGKRRAPNRRCSTIQPASAIVGKRGMVIAGQVGGSRYFGATVTAVGVETFVTMGGDTAPASGCGAGMTA